MQEISVSNSRNFATTNDLSRRHLVGSSDTGGPSSSLSTSRDRSSEYGFELEFRNEPWTSEPPRASPCRYAFNAWDAHRCPSGFYDPAVAKSLAASERAAAMARFNYLLAEESGSPHAWLRTVATASSRLRSWT
jgi:hypothetical protein